MIPEKLLNGIAVVIDDQIGNESEIDNLISQIKKQSIPYITYKELPKDDIEHFDGISFILLDWKLQKVELTKALPKGVTQPTGLSKFSIEENISFLKKMTESCFTPIFIFTNESVSEVIEILKSNDLYHDNKPNYIFVKNKKDLKGRTKLFKTIEDWIKKTPSIYILKAWEKEYQRAKNKLFHDFYRISPNWPTILWQSFSADGVNMSLELGEMITKNLYTRMSPFDFDAKILNKQNKKAPKDEMRKVVEGERFILNEGLHQDSIAAGDVFKVSDKFFLNIRPDCDCIAIGSRAETNNQDVELYLLEGTKLSDKKEKKLYRKQYGNFSEIDSQSIVFSMLGGKTYDFRFKNLAIKKWAELKDKRVGRLLPPYITRIQQRYSLYLQRQGLPRTPDKAIL